MAFAAAHRGLSSEEPENTLASFKAALDAGFCCLEMDLRRTHDGQVVVMHDAGIDRTTDGNGRIQDFTYKELLEFKTANGPVPRLTDVMGELTGSGIYWNLEVKAKSAVEPTIELVEEHGLEDQALVSSMSPTSLRTAKERHPDVPRGLIVLGPVDDLDIKAARDAGCSWMNLDHDFVTTELVDKIKDEGFKVGVWTVNDPDRALELTEHGAQCIITDRRDVLAALPNPRRIEW